MFIAVLFAFLVFIFVLFRGDNIDIYDYISSAFYAIASGIIVFLLVIFFLARNIGIFFPKDYTLIETISLVEIGQKSGKFLLIEVLEKGSSYNFYYRNNTNKPDQIGKLKQKTFSGKNISRIYKQYREDAFAEIYTENFPKKWYWIFAIPRLEGKYMRYKIYLPIKGALRII